MKKKGMNALLGVASGSAEPPRLVIIEYNKGKKNLPLYGLVGKGITFDSGGISLKPSKNMHEMKYDKSGAIVVLGAMKAIAELKMPDLNANDLDAAINIIAGTAKSCGITIVD